MGVELFSLANPVFSSYVFYGTVVLLKLLAMGPLTSFRRVTRKVIV